MENFAYFAHQPILDRHKNLHAYELLFRNSDDNVFPSVSEDDATDSLVANSLLGQSLDMLSRDAPCFVNFPHQSLIEGLPSLLSPQRIVVEVLESVKPDEQILNSLFNLRSSNYKIALDDYSYDVEWEKNLDVVDIVKFDLTAQSWEELEQLTRVFAKGNKILLAEKVETYEEFEKALSMGFDLFQGYFFSKPTIVKHRPLGTNKLTVLRLFDAVSGDSIDFDLIEKLLSSDVALSYQMLNVVNNKLGFRAARINSLRQAAIYLGDCELRKFIGLIGARIINQESPFELHNMAMTRGFYCETLLNHLKKTSKSQYFMLGLFSLIDVILEHPMEDLLARMPLADDITGALVEGIGIEADVLALCEAHERADWSKVESLATDLSVSSDVSYRAYTRASIASSEIMQMASE